MKLIAVIGIDGSGKSTLIEGLKETFPQLHVNSIWDTLKVEELAKNIGFESKSQIDSYLSNLGHQSRSLFLFHCIFESFTRAIEKDYEFVILDGYWFKYASTEIELGSSNQLIKNLSLLFPKPDLIFHLNTPSQLAVTRRTLFSNYECGMKGINNRNAFIDFQSRVSNRLLTLTTHQNLVTLNGSLSPQSILANAKNHLNKLGLC